VAIINSFDFESLQHSKKIPINANTTVAEKGRALTVMKTKL
jgi:hypothetical protein